MTMACDVPACFKKYGHKGDHDPWPPTREQMVVHLEENIGAKLASLKREGVVIVAPNRAPLASNWVDDWWRHNRKLWGKLQQVRKGTRVKCPCCDGSGAGGECPLCGGEKFLDRDEALSHLEMEMEMACK